MARVERLDRGACVSQQGLVAGQRLLGGVAKIREQGKEQVGIAIAQVADMQRFEQIIELLRAAEQGRDDHHRAVRVRDAAGKIQARQCAWRHEQRDQQVHQRDGQCRGAHGAGEGKQPVAPVTRRETVEREQHDRGRQRGEQRDGAEIQEQADTPARADDPRFQRHAAADRTLQIAPSVIDQVIPDVCAAIVGIALGGRCLRERNGFPCHREFAALAAARDILDDVPVTVTGGEILARVHACRVFAQGLLDDTERLDVIAPVHGADEAQAADAVGDGDLVGRGRPAGGLRQLGRGYPLFEQLLLDPGLDEGHGRALGLEPGVELLHEWRGQRHIGVGKFGQQLDQLFRIAFGRLEHAVGPGDGRIALLAPAGDAHRNAAQVFQQRQLQHDRECPEFAEHQGFERLVGGDELGGVVAVDAPVHVGNQFQREVVDAREAR